MLRKIYNKIVDSINIDTDLTINLNSEKRVRVFIYTEQPKYGKRYIITPNQEYINAQHKERFGVNYENTEKVKDSKI